MGRVRQSQATRCGGNARRCLEMVSELTQSLVSIGRHPASSLPKSRQALPIVTGTCHLEANQISALLPARFSVTVVKEVFWRTILGHPCQTDYAEKSVICKYPRVRGFEGMQRHMHFRPPVTALLHRVRTIDTTSRTSVAKKTQANRGQ